MLVQVEGQEKNGSYEIWKTTNRRWAEEEKPAKWR